MNQLRMPQLRMHELIFVSFLLVTAGRLLVAGAGNSGLKFAVMAAVIVAVVMIAMRWPSRITIRLRLAVFPLLVNVVYWQLGPVVQDLGSAKWDAALLHADRVLLGETPAVTFNSWSTHFLTEILSFCYILFFPAVLLAFVIAIIRPEPDGVRLFNGLISIYALGFLGYTLVPAAGPHLTMPDAFAEPLAGGPMTRVNDALVSSGSNQVDVFPSLHAAITVYLMGCLWMRHRRLFLLFLLPATGLCVATLYLRYHYAIDVVAGAVLAVVGLMLARIPYQSHSHPIV